MPNDGALDVEFPVKDRATRQTLIKNMVCPVDGGALKWQDGSWRCTTCDHDELAERKKNN